MLNQRHTRELLQTAQGDVVDHEATLDLILDSLALMRDGGDHEFGRIPHANEQVLAALQKSRLEFNTKQEIANEFLAATHFSDPVKLSSLRKALVEQTRKAHAAAHAVVTTICEENAKAANANVSFAIIGALFATLICTGFSYYSARKANAVLFKSAESIETTGSTAQSVSQNAAALRNAVEQFETSIQEIACNATNAATVASNAVGAAGSTTETIARLGSSSSEIGEMIRVINSIAEQTNLLALNATIEAARAGEAGKGFAVVANEVKELAAQTSQATEDIVRRIEAIQADTMEATDAIGLVSGIITQINESQNAIAGAVEEQTAMTGEISRTVAELADGTGDIADTVCTLSSLLSDKSETTDRARQQLDSKLTAKYRLASPSA